MSHRLKNRYKVTRTLISVAMYNSYLDGFISTQPLILTSDLTRRKVRKSEEKEAEVHYVDKQRGIAVVLEGEGKDLKGKGSFNTGMVLSVV